MMFLNSLNTDATAHAAITDGIEPAKADIFEPGRLNMPSSALGFNEFQGFILAYTSAGFRVIFKDKVDEGLSYNHAHLCGFTGIGA